MIPSASYTSLHSFVAHAFNRQRMQARKKSLLAKILGRNSRLKYLSENIPSNAHTKLYAGVQNIHVEKIVGTVNRTDDFDSEFRPRKAHLRDRWVNMFILLQSDGWSPIVVHKAGDVYYVEDGHHRVSVARSEGMLFMEAIVWDYAVPVVRPCACRKPRPLTVKPLCACALD